MERIDYGTYIRRAHQLRTDAIADFGRGIVMALVRAYRSARRSLAAELNRQAPATRAC